MSHSFHQVIPNRALGAAFSLLLALLFGCEKVKTQQPAIPEGPSVVSAEAAAPAPAVPSTGVGNSEEPRPIFPSTLSGKKDPQAAAYCEAVHGLPESRRAACCQSPMGIVLTDDCVRVLSYSVRSGALVIDERSTAECKQKVEQQLASCDFIGPFPPQLPEACEGVLRGTLTAGGRCRSSLECQGTLRCVGVGPTSLGTCHKPREDGAPCGLAVDPLAAFTRGERLVEKHSECSGFCGRRHICESVLPRGATCVMREQCGKAGRCVKGHCVDGGIAKLGEPCGGSDCAAGLRCFQHRCIDPGSAGASCSTDFDCLGGCNRSPDKSDGPGICGAKCTMR
jgi:hypothetical protein